MHRLPSGSLFVSRVLVFLLLLLLHSPSLRASTTPVGLIVSTSRYYYNYRHTSNALLISSLLGGDAHSHSKLLMLADFTPFNPRNVHQGSMYSEAGLDLDLMQPTPRAHWGNSVTVQTFLLALTRGTSASKPLNLSPDTDLLIYLTGHGGVGFLKFQDAEELSSADLSQALKRTEYRRCLIIADTCQAATLSDDFDGLRNVTFIGSSKIDQNSYALTTSPHLGAAVVDR